VSVAHFGEQRGDLMRDPEIVFEVAAGEWHPVNIQMDYTGNFREAVFVDWRSARTARSTSARRWCATSPR
jgi:hypothetical protein